MILDFGQQAYNFTLSQADLVVLGRLDSSPRSHVLVEAAAPAEDSCFSDTCGETLLDFDEPPDADPHVRWCGRGSHKSDPYPDLRSA